MSVKNVLVFVEEESDRQHQIERAQWLASVYDASIELFSCVYDRYLESERARSNVMAARRESLDNFAEQLRREGLGVKTDVAWHSDIDDAVLAKVAESHSDLVVKDTHYHSVLRRTILTNDDWNLIARCPVPLMLVKERNLPSPPTVVAAVDPMHTHDKPKALDRRILGFAKSLVQRAEAQFRVVHIFDASSLAVATATSAGLSGAALSGEAAIAAMDASRSEAKGSFNALIDEEGVDAACAEFLEGDVSRGLIEYTDSIGADILVMGAVTRGRIESALIGHTAQQVLDWIGCDLIVVK